MPEEQLVSGITAGSCGDYLDRLHRTARQELDRLHGLWARASEAERIDLEAQVRAVKADLAEKQRQAMHSLF